MPRDPKFFEPQLPQGTLQLGDDEALLLAKIYQDYSSDRDIKNQGQDILNGLTLQTIWDTADKEYNIFFPEKVDNWRKRWNSAISQDKINDYLASIATDWIFPEVLAVNNQNNIDRVISRVAKATLEHAEKNDGRPDANGHLKFVRQTHSTLKYGTSHRQHDVINNQPVTSLVPNEEIFIPNFFEPDIQNQPHVIRVRDGVTFEEAKAVFGDLPNFKYVHSGGVSNWQLGTTPLFRNYDTGIVQKDRVQIIYAQYPVPEDKLDKGRKKQKYFNIAINGVLMFKAENKSPYRHGLYNISKWQCDIFDANYYWGKPIYLRFKVDKDAYDEFRSIVLNKEKLSLNRPLVSMNGLHVDQDIVVPGRVSSITDDIGNLATIPGIGEPPQAADFSILQMLKQSVESSAITSTKPGQAPSRQGVRTTQIQEATAQKASSIIGLMFAFGVEAGAYQTIRNCFQFYPRQKLEKLSLPNQQLATGRQGDIEVLFQKIPKMTADEQLKHSTNILHEEMDANQNGQPKEKLYIDPSYLDTLDLYMEVSANPINRPNKAFREQTAQAKYALYKQDTMVNQEWNTRNLVRAMGDNEDEAIQPNAQPGQAPQPGQQQGAPAFKNNMPLMATMPSP